MRYNVSHYFEKELTWLMRSYYDCINKEAIGKVKVVQVAAFQLLEYQMVMAEGQICYSREIGLCPPCTEATPSAEGGYPL